MKNDNNSTYSTKDFYIACILRALSYQLIRLDRNTSDIATFVFSDPQITADSDVQLYWDRKLLVDSRGIVDAIHELKSRLKGNYHG